MVPGIRWQRVAIAGLVAFSMVLLAPAFVPLARGASEPMAGGAPQQWAYGGQEWLNLTYLTTSATETTRTFYGWQVLTTATNTTSNLTAVKASTAWQYTYFLQYCIPTCAHSTYWANVSLSEWYAAASFVNLTNAAKVYENSTAVAAFGIVNASTLVQSNVSESWKSTQGSQTLSSGVYYSAGAANSTVAFKPALGLIPLSAKPGQSWTATSAFNGSGGWTNSYFERASWTGNLWSWKDKASGLAANWGNESVAGKDLGLITLSNGAKASEISLSYQGPYSIASGLFITPSGFVLFGGANQNWSVQVLAPAAITTSTIDVAVSHGNNTPFIIAGSSSWSQSGKPLGGSSSPPGNGSSPPASKPAPPQSGSVQAQPEPVPYAVAKAQCLIGPCAAESPTASGGLPLSWLIGAALAAGVGGGVGVGLFLRRRPPMARAADRQPPTDEPRSRVRTPPAHRAPRVRTGPRP